MIYIFHDDKGEIGVNGEMIEVIRSSQFYEVGVSKIRPWFRCGIEIGGRVVYVRETVGEVLYALNVVEKNPVGRPRKGV